jgi:hypothetical protein
MTLLTLDIPTLADSPLPGSATVVQAHLTIAINLGASPPQVSPGTGAHATAQIDDLVSDDDEFTSVPSATATAAVPATGDLVPPAVQANGIDNGHTTLVG